MVVFAESLFSIIQKSSNILTWFVYSVLSGFSNGQWRETSSVFLQVVTTFNCNHDGRLGWGYLASPAMRSGRDVFISRISWHGNKGKILWNYSYNVRRKSRSLRQLNSCSSYSCSCSSSGIIAPSCSVYRIWNIGWILEFKVSKRLSRTFWI